MRRLAGGISLLGLRVRRAQFLDAQLREPLTHIDGSLKGLALYYTSDESSSESIASTVGIVDLLIANGVHRNFLDVHISALLCADGNGRIGTLREDYSP